MSFKLNDRPEGQHGIGGTWGLQIGLPLKLQTLIARQAPLDSSCQREAVGQSRWHAETPANTVLPFGPFARVVALLLFSFGTIFTNSSFAQTIVMLKPRISGVVGVDINTVASASVDAMVHEGLRVVPYQEVMTRANTNPKLNCDEPICAANVAHVMGGDYAVALTVWTSSKGKSVTATVADMQGESAGADVKVVSNTPEALHQASAEAVRQAWSRKKYIEMPELLVVSRPGGATVYIDGTAAEGKTSDAQPTAEQLAALTEGSSATQVKIQSEAREKLQAQVWHRKIEPGVHDVVIELKNYLPQRVKLKVDKKERKLLEFDLKEGQGSIVNWLAEGKALKASEDIKRANQKGEVVRHVDPNETRITGSDMRDDSKVASSANYWLAGGLGALGVGLLIPPILTLAQQGDLTDQDQYGRPTNKIEMQAGQWAMLVGGGVSLAAAAYFLFGKPIKTTEQTLSVMPMGFGGVAVKGKF